MKTDPSHITPQAPASSSASTPEHPSRWQERLAASWRGLDGQEVGIVFALLALCVLVRLLRLQPIEYYHDEVSRWNFVRQWFHENEFRDAVWTHHMARFGINVPLFFVQLLFGKQPLVYYVWPLTSFALQVLLLYLTARRVGGRAAGVLGALFLSVFTGMDRGACQLMPDAFGATAMMLVCYLMVRYQEASPARSMRWLVGCGLAFVWAYETKESNLLLFPGSVAAVWLCRGRFKDALVFSGILLAAAVLETACFRLFTNYSSRFAIVNEAHGDIPYIRFWQLFERFTRLEPAWQMLVWMWVPSALWLAASRDRRQQALALVPAAFLFFLTFTVRSINPTMVWVRFYSRYIEPAAPLLVLGVALFVVEAARRAWASHAPSRFAQLPSRLNRWAIVPVVLVCCLIGFVERADAEDYLPHHPFRETRRISKILNDAYRRNLPIVMDRNRKREEEDRKIRPLKLAYGVYLEDSALLDQDVAKKGWLPDMLEGIRHEKRYSYVLKDAKPYTKGKVDEWVERGCAVVLTEAKNRPGAAHGVPSLVLKRPDTLPPECQPPG